MTEAYVTLKSVTTGYGRDNIIHRDMDLNVAKGEILCLIGPNGAGKSTLLKTMAGVLPLISGHIYIDGKEVPAGGRERARLIASVLTTPPITEYMSVYDVVAGGRYAYTGNFDIHRDSDREIVREALTDTETWDIRDRDFTRLSDGQRQRVMIARALAMEPKLMILDEPVSHLDIYYKQQVFDILKRLKQTGDITVIMSLHELTDVAGIADRVVALGASGIALMGKPDEVMTDENIRKLFWRQDKI